MDHIFADFSLPDVPGASVMVIKDRDIVLAKSYGLANLETGDVCTAKTNFRLASVTKQFTAMCVMILIERGAVSFGDCLLKFFPGFPAYGKDITVRQLLTHTSGLLDYEDLIPKDATEQVKDKDVLHLLSQQNKTMFPPGSKFHYSNSGFAMLAMIVQTASGKPFATFLHQNIFKPAGMTNTVAYEKGISTVKNRALGYSAMVKEKEKRRVFEMTDQSLTSAVLGDGGIYSSTADMCKWDKALYTDKLVSRDMLRQAFTAHSDISDSAGSGYGFGWYVGTRLGVPCYWHYGGTCGFSTHIERYPQKKLTLIVLANRRSAPLADISSSVIDLYWS